MCVIEQGEQGSGGLAKVEQQRALKRLRLVKLSAPRILSLGCLRANLPRLSLAACFAQAETGV